MKKTLFVPDLMANLISVNAIAKNDGVLTFAKNKVTISFDNKTLCEGSKQINGLYVVKLACKNYKDAAMTGHEEYVKLWHSRLVGQLVIGSMKKLTSLVYEINTSSRDFQELGELCEICIEAKQTSLHLIKIDREQIGHFKISTLILVGL